MELLAIYDEHGVAQNLHLPREEVHRKGFWHRTVHIWVLNQHGELLIQRRSATKDAHPGLWDISAAGHIGADEQDMHAALREVAEEVGIEAQPEELEYLFTTRQHCILNDGAFIDNELSQVYLLRTSLELSQLRAQPQEVAELCYLPLEEFQRRLSATPDCFVAHPDEYHRLIEYLTTLEP